MSQPRDGSTTTPRRAGFSRILLRPRNLLVVGAIAAVFFLLVAVALTQARALSSIRGYVMGEGLWSKAQKRAVIALHRYADTGREAEWERFEDAVGVILGDRRARLELESREPDRETIREGFRTGGIPEHAIEGMAWLFTTFDGLDEVERALAIWARGDERIDELVAVAEEIRGLVRSEDRDGEELEAALERVHALDQALTALEDDFTLTLDRAAERLDRLILASLLALAAIFVASGSAAALFLYRQLRAGERRLARSEARYRSLFEQNVVGVALSTLDGALLEANPAFARTFGYGNPSELKGVPAEELYADPSDRSALVARLREDGGPVSLELGFRRRDGSGGQAIVSAVLVPGRDGGGERLVTTVLDITERIAMEERLLRTGRMEAMGKLAGGVAQDFNNLLTAIKGSAELLADEVGEEDAEVDALLDDLRSSAASAAALTRELLDFSRGRPPDVQAVEPDAELERLRGFVRRIVPGDVEVEVRTDASGATVDLSPARFEQVVVNLVLNAREAMAEGGRLAVSTELVEPGPEAAARLGIEPGAFVRLEVRDSGVGIAPENLDRVFEPFFTTRRDEGRGMGLASVFGLVTAAGGTVEVESEPGQGATFSVYLPVARMTETAVEARLPGPPADADPDGPIRVLLAEDEEVVRSVARRVLERDGFAVTDAPDAPRALELLDAGFRPHVVVTDIVMPGGSGPWMVERIRERHGPLPVLYVSGYTDRDLSAAEQARADTAFLPKPFETTDLLAAVRDLLARVQKEGRKGRR